MKKLILLLLTSITVMVANAQVVTLDAIHYGRTDYDTTTGEPMGFNIANIGTVSTYHGSKATFVYTDGVGVRQLVRVVQSVAAVSDSTQNKQYLSSPTFTGTVTIPTPFTLGAVSVLPTGTELNYVDGVTSAIQTQFNAIKADRADYVEMIPLKNIIAFSDGEWTVGRIARGNYGFGKTASDNTSIIGIDITPQLIMAASKGFKLVSFDVVSTITTDTLDAHTVTLDKVVYANNTAVAITGVTITGTLPIIPQTNPYVTNVTVNTPVFVITPDTKYVLEVTVNAATTTDYFFNGITLKYTRQDN